MPDDKPTKLLISIGNLKRALRRLGEALQISDDNALVVDGTIQRFEFAIELCWKTLRRALLVEGIETTTPREALREAYRVHWLEDEAVWLSMLKDRNETSHVYSEEKAREIYGRIGGYHAAMLRVLETLTKKYRSQDCPISEGQD